MVAVIQKPSDSIRHTLNYNENKIKDNVAKLIDAVNYPKDADQLTFKDKLNRLKNQAALNPRVKKHSVHISLNFDPSERGKLTHDQYREMAKKYMEGIGYGQQPYLLYEHLDSGHPHVHIVTINVQANGKRIPSHNIGKEKSELTRKTIEKEYGMVIAEKQMQAEEHALKPVTISKAHYGKAETKRQISNILYGVLDTYKYSSLAELNAVLLQYNVMADRGGKDSRIYKNGGLVYRAMENGKPVGVPIPASHFFNKPTLKFLQQQFEKNDRLKYQINPAQKPAITVSPDRRLKQAIDLAFKKQEINSIAKLKVALEKDSIHLHAWTNAKGVIYGITYTDHKMKCVFNGNSLGKAYSANAIQQRCRPTLLLNERPIKFSISRPEEPHSISPHFSFQVLKQGIQSIIAELQQEEYAGQLAYELRENERKRKKRKQNIQ
jgi:hypothetical protein